MTKRPRYSKEFKDSMIALYQEGRSFKSLEKEFGMSSTTVLKWAHGAQKQMIGDTFYTNNDIKKENDHLREENVLEIKRIRHSYSKKGHPCDNARIEDCHSILKRELNLSKSI